MKCKNGHPLRDSKDWVALKYGEKACALCASKFARGKGGK